ncbi:grasp-with-spasm system A modified peptide [Elizabethkingia meningoseptica]|uniref:grasp-with-spasm system A modified peptide n=1 Tax=Elizabethkingia meningoseptica TaxID=238 RepID=UPI001365A1D4|nr:grasp-with-spasm system A modified peptide [Elizabethkingia meningoseptica]MDE5488265.1 grasp-with-spasm system A modified peptide [Elizabethkingia meningoseptica]MVW93205.1 grasp-with-spasm system A modified peptide [Elizabethkingia meningoseptica]
MKKLNGIKNGFSTLENKRLENLKFIAGGEKVTIKSNIVREDGATEADVYDRAPDGTLINGRRSWILAGPIKPDYSME